MEVYVVKELIVSMRRLGFSLNYCIYFPGIFLQCLRHSKCNISIFISFYLMSTNIAASERVEQ